VIPQVALSTSDWIFLAGVMVNGLAFVGVIVSLLLLRTQGLTQCDATLSVAYQNMAAQMADMARFFVDNSDLRPYFFGNKALPASREEHNRVLAVAEMYVNLMDNVLTQAPVLKRAGIAADWEAACIGGSMTDVRLPKVTPFWPRRPRTRRGAGSRPGTRRLRRAPSAHGRGWGRSP
jgi:hypothetical protein